METSDVFTKAKLALFLKVPFFASLLADMMKVKVGDYAHLFPPGLTPTAATDGKTIYLHEPFIAQLTLPEVVFLLCHEIGHAMFHHIVRAEKYKGGIGPDGRPFSAQKWNMATDYAINGMLISAGIGKMPAMGLYDARYVGMLADVIYKALPDDPDGNSMDHHMPASKDAPSGAEWKRAIVSAKDTAKAMGNMPGAVERFVDDLVNPQVPWADHLRKSVNRAAGRDASTWVRPNRRRLFTQGIVLPSKVGTKAGTIAVAFDTSGSVSEGELRVFISEVDSILGDLNPERVIVMGVDMEVHDVVELQQGDSVGALKPVCKGGGGTRFAPAFEKLDELGVIPDTFIYFTDMCASFPDEPTYPVIWCASTEKVAPWGETIHVKVTH